MYTHAPIIQERLVHARKHAITRTILHATRLDVYGIKTEGIKLSFPPPLIQQSPNRRVFARTMKISSRRRRVCRCVCRERPLRPLSIRAQSSGCPLFLHSSSPLMFQTRRLLAVFLPPFCTPPKIRKVAVAAFVHVGAPASANTRHVRNLIPDRRSVIN